MPEGRDQPRTRSAFASAAGGIGALTGGALCLLESRVLHLGLAASIGEQLCVVAGAFLGWILGEVVAIALRRGGLRR